MLSYKKSLKTYFLVIFFLVSKLAEATHVVGGEIYYDYLGGGNYKLHMKVYRDCLNGIPELDGFPGSNNNANFTIYDTQGNVILSSIFNPINISFVPPTINSPCAPVSANNACVQEGIYEATINLPPNANGYYIAYQRCCRNGTILNLISPGDVGATYWEFIPGTNSFIVNSSPRFTNRPPIYICLNKPIAFDHVATDPDGDSLVYSLCTPFNGLNAYCPFLNIPAPQSSSQCPNPPSACPNVNTPPPYISVPFSSPYSASYPMASNPAININSNTGFLNGNPTIQGQWVVGVCVEEYRNGVLIATHHRDFQFNVIPCPGLPTAGISSQTTTNNGQGTGYCNGFTITFTNDSLNNNLGTTTYQWNFGDPTTLTDTANLPNASYTYPTPGIYTVTMVATNITGLCSAIATTTVYVYPLLKPDYITPTAQCFNGNSFNFNGGGTFQGTGTFAWNFGANATPQSASTASVSNVSFNAPGIYPVVFSVSENSCTATVTKTIEVVQNPTASIGTFPSVACDPLSVSFNNTSTASTPMTYLWTFSDGTISSQQNPTHVFTPAGIYSFTLSVSTSQKCIDTSQVLSPNSITVTPSPTADFNILSTTGLCFNGNNFTFTDASIFVTPGTILWDFGTSASTQTATSQTVSNVSYNTIGTYPITLIANENGCIDTITKNIELYENPIAAVAPIISLGCDPMTVSFQNESTAASNASYLWSFSDGTTSTLENPVHVFSPPGIYNYTLTINTTSKCIDTNQIVSVSSITVNPSPIANFVASPLVTTIFDPDIFFFNTSPTSNIITWFYDFDDGTGSNDVNPIHTYATWGDYYVTQTVTNTYACSNSMTILVKVLPEFRFWIPNAFTPGNKDGLNDVFKPIVIGVEDYTFRIFNRWGEQIYKTNDTEAGWNGTYKGKSCTDDVYVWKCEFQNIVSKEYESRVGHVMLVR
jgi:gliding motility-associated-like protein